jgi:hypothetical protein
VGPWVGVSIATTRLILVTSAIVVTVGILVHLERKCLSAPALSHVLSCRELVAHGGTLCNADIVGHGGAGEGVDSQLSSRIVLLGTSNISVLRSAIRKERANLLGYCIAVELNDLLAHVRVTRVDGPGGITIVAWDIHL